LTKSGNAIGTFQYIAPERLGTRAEEDARADIYSLACVLYECLTGSPPFPGDSMESQVAAHLTDSPPQPSITQPEVPAQMDPVIATGMAKDPEQRYPTTIELAHAARTALTTPLPRPSPPPAAPTMPAPRAGLDAGLQRPPAAGGDGDARRAGAVSPAAPTQQRTPSAPSLPVQPPEGPRPPAAKKPRKGLLIALTVVVAVIALAVVLVTVFSNNDHRRNPTTTAATPTNSPASLTGKWSGPVFGDQSGFGVVADIVDSASLTATVSYPQLNCGGIWTQHGSAGNGVRFVTERITYGSCVTSEVTLTPQDDGTLYFTSTYYSAAQQRNFNTHATLRRSANG
jgi:serine/threonine protein kinase